ncbi:MAG: hypothetical protein GF334_10925 [Candidatus Altiarchaeales archaeon]|nr:hypothetical protein [Candidatus Altiarchaeales archaeon]
MISIQRKRANRIFKEVPILQVLYDYGYYIDADNPNPQQFSCDLHGSGMDRKPSGRVYPESNNWHCWGCGKSRDSIETVREKEHVTFDQACKILEKKYGLPEVDWGADEEFVPDEDAFALERAPDFSEHQERCQRILELETEDKDLPMKTVLSLWEAFDQIVYLVDKKKISEPKGMQAFEKIKKKVQDLRESYICQELGVSPE